MTESLLARLSQTSIQNPELTQTQRSIDQAIGQFTHEMTNTQALFSMATGSLFYRFGRLATLSLAPHVGSFAPVLQASSYIVGLSSEVLAFEGTNRLLARATGNTAALQTPFWEGVRSSFVNFGALKVFGHLGAQQNAVIRNLMADAGMVAGHELTYRLGFTPQQEGTLLERMVEAQITNFQLGMGTALMGQFTRGLHTLERSMDSRLHHESRNFLNQEPSSHFSNPLLAMATPSGIEMGVSGGGKTNPISQTHMSMMGAEGRVSVQTHRPHQIRKSSSPIETRTLENIVPVETSELTTAREHLDRYQKGKDGITTHEAFQYFRQHPEAARQALIGRTDLSSFQLDFLHPILNPNQQLLTRPEIKRVLIPNRGEIAIRLTRAMVEEGIIPFVTVSESDSKAQWVREVEALGGRPLQMRGQTAQESYLDIRQIIDLARQAQVDAIHPGYGYRSESTEFAQRLRENQLVLIGPSVEAMALTGDKDAAKRAFREAGVPIAAGTERGYLEVEPLLQEIQALRLPYPLRLKATGGGGGRGQATVYNETQLRDVFSSLSLQAKNAFGKGDIMAEIYVPRFQHVEFQIMADRFGNVIHLGERECSLQEADQKLVEIHPAEIFNRFDGLRQRMARASVEAARAMGYTGHGTVEFMVNPDTGEFYALEVNARIQVEHRVSELVSGIDIVREAIRVAQGNPLSLRQDQITLQGAAVEVRIKAVNPDRRDAQGRPQAAPGRIDLLRVLGTNDFQSLESQGVYIETSVFEGDSVNPHADPMIMKILVTGQNRQEALSRMRSVLEHTTLEGSQGFHSDLLRNRRLLETQRARSGDYDNRFVDRWTKLGGEDRSALRHREQHSILGNSHRPFIHLEITREGAITNERSEELERAVSDLLDLSQSETSNTLHGLLAERFSDSSFRSAFLNETQSQNLRVRAQVDSTGHLRQISLFSNQKPVRQLIVSEGRVSYNDVEPTSILYDVDFSRSENPAQGQVTLYRRGVSKPVFQGGIESHPDQASLYRIFPRTGVELQLRVMKSAFQTSHQYNDRAGNLISFVSSTEVNENYTQRLLSLMEQSSLNNPLPIREEASRNIHVILDTIASDSPQSSRRQEAMRELCQTPATLIGTLLRWMRETKNISTRQFLDEVLAQRELRDYDITYRTLDAHNAEARFSETEGPIRLIRHYSPEGESLQEAIQSAFSHLDRESETTQSVRIILRRAESEINEDALSAEFQQASREILERNPTLASAREISLIVERNGSGAYPNFYTFKPNSDRIYQEDLRLRNLHPNDQIEFWRLGHFNTRRLMNHSDRFVHIYEGRHAASKDHRLFGHVVIPEAHAERDSSGALVGIPLIEAGVTHLIRSMQSSLNEMPTSDRPSWNRIFINIPPVMRISGNEAENFAIHLAEKYSDAFRSLHLEKVVVRARLQDDRAPGGYRDVLIRVQNPSGYAYESRLDTIVEGYLEGNNTARSILLRNGHYERWLQNPAHLFRAREASPADLTIQPLTPVEQRRQKERSKGGIFAYDLPALLHREAQQFREGLLLRQGTTETHSNRRSIFDSLRPESGRWNDGFVELDLDPQSLRIDPRTQQLDYNHGDFIPAMDKSNPNETRPMGQNEAGIVIGIKTDDLGIGIPVRRLVLMGDLTYFRNAIVNGEKLREGLGSLSARECTRIIASIRYAAREGIPIDWFTASSGAEIHPERGVEGLDATAAVVREIVLHAHSQGVRMNMVVHDTNIGAQSYWNSLASILHDTGGTLIMTKRGNMALTGADAWTAAMIPNIHSEDLPAKSKYFYPQGLRTLAGYTEVHGPNSEAMAGVENTREAIQLLLRHHYYTYARAGELVSLRSLGAQDPHDRDITQAVSLEGLDGRTITRRVGDEIRSILEGRGGNREAILNSLRDVGSPAPVPWWQNAVGVRGQEPGNGLMPQRFGSLIQEIQIGGQPTLAIFPPVGPLTPADSDIIARAIWKANERLPVLLIGSLSGFNGDPRSMQNRQLTYGARIAEAIVRFKGPITIVNMGYIVGGTKVVVSNQLNPHLTAIALEGAHETVVGGALYGKVVSRSRVREEAGLDPRMPGASEEIRREIIREIENRKGQTFADHHSVERARQVGAISEVIPASALRPTIIRIQREVRARFEENQRQQNSQITIHAANAGPVRSLLQSLGLPFREDPSGNLIVGMEVFQRLLANGHSDRGE